MKILSILFFTFLTYAVAELGYRAYHYQSTKSASWPFLAVSQPIYEPDAQVGYRYRPGVRTLARWHDEEKLARTTSIRTNNLGLVSDFDVAPKAPGEFRIAIVGDSLTACIHSNSRWPDEVQKILNRDPFFKKRLGAKKITVLNLGLDGAALSQFPDIIEHIAKPLKPDFIVAGFITADIYRRKTWRSLIQIPGASPGYLAMLACAEPPASLANEQCVFSNVLVTSADGTELATITHEVGAWVAKRTSPLTLYPELLSFVLQGKLEAMFGRNPYQPKSTAIEDRQESLQVGREALLRIASSGIPTDVQLLPTYWEIVHDAVPKLAGELMKLTPEVPIYPMLISLPTRATRDEIDSWINIPHDMHWSEVGNQMYAQAMANRLKDVFSQRNHKIRQDGQVVGQNLPAFSPQHPSRF